MFRRLKRFTREGGVAQILMDAHKLSRDEAFALIEQGKMAGFTKILDSDVLNNHDRVSILLKAFDKAARSMVSEMDEDRVQHERVRVWVAKTAVDLIGIQVEMGRGSDPMKFKGKAMDLFFHGYIFGVIDALLQKSGIDDQSESLEIMQEAHEHIFYSGVGQEMLKVHLEYQHNQRFQEGAMKGGEEVFAFLFDATPPMGLTTFFQELEE